MSFSVQNIYGLLLRSRLLPLAEAQAMFQRWQTEARDAASDVERFKKWLVQNNYVTEYQALLLGRGHAEGFFLNDYKILDRIGQGRMAGVYKAVHRLGQVVAIKVLPPSRAKDPQMLARFQREAHLVLRLKHPNVVRAFQTGEASGLHYIVMEYLEGETLDEVLHRRGKLPPAEAVRIVYQVLCGLQHLHEQGLVHRDVKPSNLMLIPGQAPGQPDTTMRATVKILDIGLGRAFFDENSPEAEADPQLTGEGVLLGTPDYLAPEQARNARAADIRADIYSIGCVLYRCLSGQPPFPDANIVNQMVRHATETARPLKEFNPEVPDGLQQIVNWMMAKDPGQRYPNPERAAQALQMFLVAGTEPGKDPEPDAQMNTFLSWLEAANESGKPAAPAATRPREASAKKGAARATSERRALKTARKLPAAKSKPAPETGKPSRKAAVEDAPPTTALPTPIPLAQPILSAPPPADAAPMDVAEVNVELVPIDPATNPIAAFLAGQFGLSRRDFLMLGIGSGTTLFLFGLYFLADWLRNRNKHLLVSPPPSEEKEE